MATCLISLKGIGADCNPQLAGIKEVFIADFNNVADITKDDATHSISSLSMATSAMFYRYTFAKQTGSLTSTLTKNEQNSTRYYTNAIHLVFNKLEAAKHIEIEALAAGQLAVIVHDNNDKYWYVGYDMYAGTTEATAQTGVSVDDQNGYTCDMSAQSAYLPFEIALDVFEDYIAEP